MRIPWRLATQLLQDRAAACCAAQQPCCNNSILHLLQQQRLQHTATQQHLSYTLNKQLADELTAAVGGKAALSAAVLQQHAVDEGYAAPMPPDIVLYPQNTQQVSSSMLNLSLCQLYLHTVAAPTY